MSTKLLKVRKSAKRQVQVGYSLLPPYTNVKETLAAVCVVRAGFGDFGKPRLRYL
jgi:hypothetical protein